MGGVGRGSVGRRFGAVRLRGLAHVASSAWGSPSYPAFVRAEAHPGEVAVLIAHEWGVREGAVSARKHVARVSPPRARGSSRRAAGPRRLEAADAMSP